ncbi:MAG: hypothetical protein Q8P84_07015 [Deltaproteobacteria bacterium]|nr:hypothetical protein [Deltaproteobacteria bacterium]
MGFETFIAPLMAPQVAVYGIPAASFTLSLLETPVFGAKPRTLPLDGLLDEPHYHNGTREGWLVYDETHLFQPHRGESLYIGDQNGDLAPHLKGRRYGERFSARALPKFLLVQSHPRLEKIKSHLIEYQGISFILEAVSPAQELLFRRVGMPKWSGLGEDRLIVFKKNGEWMAESQSVPTQPAYVDNTGDGTEAVLFEYKGLPLLPSHEITVPVRAPHGQGKELPSIEETVAALCRMPPLLMGGLQAVELIDKQHKNDFYGEMDPKGILRLYRGSRDLHLHATLFHELAHWFAMRILCSVFLAEQAHLIRAMMKDAKSPSHYAATNMGEYFAESVALYFLTDGGRLGSAPTHFRNFFRLLDQLFYDCFKSKPVHSPASI